MIRLILQNNTHTTPVDRVVNAWEVKVFRKQSKTTGKVLFL